MSSENQNFGSSPFSLIPDYVLFDNELEPNAKLLWAVIYSLSRSEGYCWAGDEYLAEKFNVDIRTIQRWLTSLKEKEYIFIDTYNDGFKKKRKIWFSRDFKEIFARRQKCPDRIDKNVHSEQTKLSIPEKAKMSYKQDNLNNINKEQQQGVVVFFDCLKDLQLNETEKLSLMKFPEKRIISAIEFIKTMKNPPDSLIATLIWHCQHENPPLPIDDSTPQQKFAKKFNEELKALGIKDIPSNNEKIIPKDVMFIFGQFGEPVKISLKNDIEELKRDFDLCRKGIEYTKNKQKGISIESK